MDTRHLLKWVGLALPIVAFCLGSPSALAKADEIPMLKAPLCKDSVKIDGQLDEPCYANTPPLQCFVIAGQPDKKAASTKAWVFWQPERLVFAFECEDGKIFAKPPSTNERDVDGQDRVELFLWSGNPDDTYYCMEIAARGAVHDYSCRFYRKFDSTWSVPGWKCKMALTDHGYRVEAALSRRAMEKCGFVLKGGAEYRAGLFRADFHNSEPGVDPDWITWFDSKTPQPDFHVAESFGKFVLKSE